MKTKERILQASLTLLNEKGASQVSLRQIATEVGISYGNLGYHFPGLPLIIRKLYDRMYTELQGHMKSLSSIEVVSDPLQLLQQVKGVLEVLDKYRFIPLDFIFISRGDDHIRQCHRKLVREYQEDLFHLFIQLREKGIVRKEISDKVIWNVIKAVMIVGHSWLEHNEIHYNLPADKKIAHNISIFLSLIQPCLNEELAAQINQLLEQGEPGLVPPPANPGHRTLS